MTDDHRQAIASNSVQHGGCYVLYSEDQSKAEVLIGFSEIRAALRDGRKRIIYSAMLSLSIAIMLAFYITPVYRAEVLLASVSSDGGVPSSGVASQLGGIASLAGINIGGTGGDKVEALATLRSRILNDIFVRENNLLPILFENKWDVTTGKWKSEDPKRIPTLWDAYKLIKNKVRQIEIDKKTGLITLSFEWKDPEIAAAWAKSYVKRANEYLREQAIAHAEKNLSYLQEQAQKSTSVELQQAIFRLMETEVKKAMIANVNEEYAFKTIDPAVAAEERERPNRLNLIIVGGFFGVLVGVVISIIKPASKLNVS